MLSSNKKHTETYAKIMDFFLSLGANQKKAEEITEIFEKKFIHTLDFATENTLDLNNPNDAATKKDLKILELGIKEATKKDLKILELVIKEATKKDLKILELGIKEATKKDLKILELVIKRDLETIISENQNTTNLKIEKLRTEAEKNKNSLIKWITVTYLVVSGLLLALIKFL